MEDSDEKLPRPLIEDEQQASRAQSPTHGRRKLWPWVAIFAATIVAALTVALVHQTRSAKQDACGTGELRNNFPTVCQRFTGGLKYDEDGNVYRDTSMELVSYIGNTSDAWKVFDAIQTIELPADEVDIDGLFVDERAMVRTIPDVFHQLHCLNQIRMALYDTDYHANDHAVQRMHIDHCIDYIRQVIQCRSDLTPLRVYYSQTAKRMMVDFEGEHQCRDFDAVVDWAWQHRATKVVVL